MHRATQTTRSSSDLDGENYCNISAEDVKTEIIEHESELGMLDRRTSTPSPINYYKPTDLTYNHRKRKAMGVEHVVGALTLTPIKAVGGAAGAGGSAGQQQHQQMNHSQLAFQALQQHFNHNHSLSLSHCNGQPQQQHHHHQQHQQQQQSLHLQQQQHSSNMAQKRDRDRDLSTSNGNGNSNCNNNNISSGSSNIAGHTSNTSLDPTATSSNCSSSSNSGTTPPKPLIGGGGLSANHVDEYGVFGEYVAITIRKLKTSKSKIVVKHLINNLLYEAELGKYDQGMPASKEPPQLYNMQ
nr:signal transducer and activator of transcription C isoform X2 [Drosophila takahashii]